MGDIGRITEEKLPEKVEAMYKAVTALLEEGADINRLKVSDITERAGIGKGTAYEYFQNKEELISSAMLYQMNVIYSGVAKTIQEQTSFENCIYFLLSSIEEKISQRECFLKFVHIITDNGIISERLRDAIREHEKKTYQSEDYVKYMIRLGKKTGEIKSNLPEEYMYFAIASKIVGYAIYMTQEHKKCSNREMQKMICEGLLRELSGQ